MKTEIRRIGTSLLREKGFVRGDRVEVERPESFLASDASGLPPRPSRSARRGRLDGARAAGVDRNRGHDCPNEPGIRWTDRRSEEP